MYQIAQAMYGLRMEIVTDAPPEEEPPSPPPPPILETPAIFSPEQQPGRTVAPDTARAPDGDPDMAQTEDDTLVEGNSISEYLNEMNGLHGHALIERLMQIAVGESLRSQATSLKGNDAVVLSDLIHECLINLSESTQHAEMLRLLQDICSASGELPSTTVCIKVGDCSLGPNKTAPSP